MGKRGPKPTPTNILAMRGSQLAKHRTGEAQPERGHVKCPSELSDYAKAAWRYYYPILTDAGLLTKADRACLASACHYLAEAQHFRERIAELRDQGRELMTSARSGMARPHPYFALEREASTMAARFMAKLGLSPADRVGLKASDANRPGNPGKSRFFDKG